jgi:hypothetical protein
VRHVPVEKELAFTAMSTCATASYVAENAPIPISEETFTADAVLRPKDLAALVPVRDARPRQRRPRSSET